MSPNENYPFAKVHETVKSYCESEDITFFDLLDGLAGQNASEMWVHPADQHPNEVAHRIAAEALADFMTAQEAISARLGGE